MTYCCISNESLPVVSLPTNHCTSSYMYYFFMLVLMKDVSLCSVGLWKIVAKFSNNTHQSFSTAFEVKDYGNSLPTRTVWKLITFLLTNRLKFPFILQSCQVLRWNLHLIWNSSMWTANSWPSESMLRTSKFCCFDFPRPLTCGTSRLPHSVIWRAHKGLESNRVVQCVACGFNSHRLNALPSPWVQ